MSVPILGFHLNKRKLWSWLVSVSLGLVGLIVFPTPVLATVSAVTPVGVSAMNTTAGYAGLISTSGLVSGQAVNFQLVKPDGEIVSFSRTADRTGSLVVELDEQHLERAGVYLISAVVEAVQTPTSTFIVRAAAFDPVQSTLQVEERAVALGEAGRVLTVLRDRFGNPISDHQLRLIPAGDEAVSMPYQRDGITDQDGMVVFEVRARRAGKSSFSLVDVTTGSVLPHKAVLAFNEVYGRGGNPFMIRRAEAVAGDYFILRGVPDQVRVGEPFSITVEAVDGQAQTLTTYTGKVRFSTTDLQAQLPSDYTFVASDAGEKKFSLAVTFATLGQQTLTVSDGADSQVKGEVVLTVTQPGAAQPPANGNGSTVPAVPLITSPQPDFVTKDSNVVVTGTVEPLVAVSIYDGLRKVGDVQASPQGQFSLDVQDLSEGNHDLTVAATSTDGRITTSDPVRVIIDKTAPAIKQFRFEPAQPQTSESMLVLLESEAGLSTSRLSIGGQIVDLTVDASAGPTWYKGTFAAADNAGNYPATVTLADAAGNPAEFKNYRTLTVAAGAGVETGAGAGAGAGAGLPGDSMAPGHGAAQAAGLKLAAQRTEGRLLFSWQKSDNPEVTGYNLYQSVAAAAGFTKVNALPITETTYLLDQQTNPEQRYYKIVAINAVGNELANSDAVAVAGYTAPGAAVVPGAGLVPPTIGVPPQTGPETWLLVALAIILAGTTVSLRRK